MPRVCRVCTSPEREQIEVAVALQRGSKRAIAQRFGISKDSLRRHSQEHPNSSALAAAAVEERVTLESIIDDLVENKNVMKAARATEPKGIDKAKINREIREDNLALARLKGFLKEGHGAVTDNRIQIVNATLDRLLVDQLRALLPAE